MTLTGHDAGLDHDPARVVTRFFSPGEDDLASRSRADQIVERVLAMTTEDVERTAERSVTGYARRHDDAERTLLAHADAVADRTRATHSMSAAQRIVVGSAFTADFAVEGAALCNPSAVARPSQDGLADGELRVAVSLRCIGEGHVSSIGFAETVIDAAGTWNFAPRAPKLTLPATSGGDWSRAHFRRAIEESAGLGDLAGAVVGGLPDRFTRDDLERAISALPPQLSMRSSSRGPLQTLRDMAASTYAADFAPETALSSRMLMPVIAEEHRGVEDARFVCFTDRDGTVGYRATYTAYDGAHIAPRLLTSPDLTSFASHRLVGSGARNKGMALFPRLVGDRHLAISRTDGENISLAGSDDGVIWDDLGVVFGPHETWELIQLGNCGSPVETDAGWLLLTHGVGPLRTYSLGALLLDLDDPRRVIGRTAEPLLEPTGEMIDGYVPRVVYSCGPIVHRDVLWVPVGVGDSRVRVYSTVLSDLLDQMTAAG